MEKILQSLSADGLQIPIALMRQYGLEPGAAVTVALQPDGIHIVPMRVGVTQIENRALRYILRYIGDAATIKIHSLPDETGWLVEVYGQGMEEPIGHLRYSLAGVLLPESSTSPAEIRRAAREAVT